MSIADQASDRTSAVSLRNSNNSRQCGLDLRLGRSSRLSTCCCCLWPTSPSSPQTPPSAFSPRGREKQNLLLDHLADPSGVRPPPFGQCVLPIPRNHLSTCLLPLCLAGPPPLPPPPSNEPQTPLPHQLEVPFSAVYHNLAAYN